MRMGEFSQSVNRNGWLEVCANLEKQGQNVGLAVVS
jgi:hypothetical protein